VGGPESKKKKKKIRERDEKIPRTNRLQVAGRSLAQGTNRTKRTDVPIKADSENLKK